MTPSTASSRSPAPSSSASTTSSVKASRARNDPRQVVADPDAPYFGARLTERMLMPGSDVTLGSISFADWLQRSLTATPT